VQWNFTAEMRSKHCYCRGLSRDPFSFECDDMTETVGLQDRDNVTIKHFLKLF